MKKAAILAGAALTFGMSAAPVAAEIVIVDASSIQGANVLFNTGTQTGTSVTASTNTGSDNLRFTGTTVGGGNVISANGGQARIEGAPDTSTPNPNDSLLLQTLQFGLSDSGTFNNLEFNLLGGQATTATFVLTDNAGDLFTFTRSLGSGSNFFGVQGINGQSIRNASLTCGAGGVGDVRQIRLDALSATSAVPEPATWAMMLIGFGAVGHSLRRRRSIKPSLVAA